MLCFELRARKKENAEFRKITESILQKTNSEDLTIVFEKDKITIASDWNEVSYSNILLSACISVLEEYGCSMLPQDSLIINYKKAELSKMNFDKFILNIPESSIYKICPDRYMAKGARSVLNIMPQDPDSSCAISELYNICNFSNDIYGIDTSSYADGIISVRYFGGSSCFKNIYEICRIIEIIDSIIESSANNTAFTESELDKVQSKYAERSQFIESFSSIENFKANTHCTVTYDLSEVYDAITFSKLRKGLYRIYLNSNLSSLGDVSINYDTDNGKFQIKKAFGKLIVSFDEPTDFVECSLADSKICGGVLVDCKAENSEIKDSYIGHGSKIENSELSKSLISEYAEVHKSYIENSSVYGKIFDCELDEECCYAENAEFRNTKHSHCKKINN